MGITVIDHFGSRALSGTSHTKFRNFQAPNPFSRIFQELEKWKNKNFQGRVVTLGVERTTFSLHCFTMNSVTYAVKTRYCAFTY